MKPGIHQIGNSEYHSGPGLSSSDLKELIKSPLHYKQYKQEPIEPFPAMILGTAVHGLILEPEKFDSHFAVGDFKVRRGKEYEKCLELNATKTILTSEQYDTANAIKDAYNKELNFNDELKRYNEGLKELSFYWEDEETGILCKARPDILTHTGAIVDLKTSSDASFDSFQNDLARLNYHISAAHYLRGVHAAGANCEMIRKLPYEFVYIVIESKAPYAIAIYKLAPEAIKIGNEWVTKALQRYSEAISTDEWVGYSRETKEMGLPNWYHYKMSYK